MFGHRTEVRGTPIALDRRVWHLEHHQLAENSAGGPERPAADRFEPACQSPPANGRDDIFRATHPAIVSLLSMQDGTETI